MDVVNIEDDKREEIMGLVRDVLASHKARCGRRFSTYYEGHAYVVVHFELSMKDMGLVAEGIDFIWKKLKEGEFDEEYREAIGVMALRGLLAVESSLNMLAMLEKLKGGVVHEPKPS